MIPLLCTLICLPIMNNFFSVCFSYTKINLLNALDDKYAHEFYIQILYIYVCLWLY